MDASDFDVASCLTASRAGDIDRWVSCYLSEGPWANHGLRDGLQRQRRYWLGPLLVALDRLVPCCGPGARMEFPVPAEQWERKVARIASGLTRPEHLPPLIVEWRGGTLSIRDGNHRHGAMLQAGWRNAWIILWCNDETAYAAAQAAVQSPARRPPPPST